MAAIIPLSPAAQHAAQFEMILLHDSQRWKTVLEGRRAIHQLRLDNAQMRSNCWTLLNVVQAIAVAALFALAAFYNLPIVYALSATFVWIVVNYSKSDVNGSKEVDTSSKEHIEACQKLVNDLAYLQFRSLLKALRTFEAYLATMPKEQLVGNNTDEIYRNAFLHMAQKQNEAQAQLKNQHARAELLENLAEQMKLDNENACTYPELIAIRKYNEDFEREKKQASNLVHNLARMALEVNNYRILHANDTGIGVR